MKPSALYFTCLEWQPENVERLRKEFKLLIKIDPTEVDDPEISIDNFDVVFWPQGYGECYYRPRVQASPTTSQEHYDLDWCKENNVQVITLDPSSVEMRSVTCTAEHTWGLIHAIHRQAPSRSKDVYQGVWDRRSDPALKMLSNMTLGIVGYGRVGERVIHIGEAYGMKVMFYDPYSDKYWFHKMDTLSDLAKEVDILVITCSYTEETNRMINGEILSELGTDGLLINTAGAGIINESELIYFLLNGKIRGAALDVISNEYTLDDTHPLIAHARMHDNLIITPHIAGSTIDAWAKTESLIIDKVLEALDDR